MTASSRVARSARAATIVDVVPDVGAVTNVGAAASIDDARIVDAAPNVDAAATVDAATSVGLVTPVDTVRSGHERSNREEPATHLAEMLRWLRRLLAWQVEVSRATYGALASDEYRGLYIPDAEAALLSREPPPHPPALVARRSALEAERDAIEQRSQGLLAPEAEPLPPLARVARLFNLTRFESDVLVLALASELDLGFERLYAYIQDDVTKKRPTVDLALRVLCESAATRMASRAAFANDAPLVRHRLVHLYEDGQRQPPLLARFIKLDDRLVPELTQSGAGSECSVDAAIALMTALTTPSRALQSLVLSDDLVERLPRTWTEHPDGLVLALQGSYGSGRRAIAEALSATTGQPLLSVNVSQLALHHEGSAIAVADAFQRVTREAALRGAAILWHAAEGPTDAPSSDQRELHASLAAALDDFRGRSVIATSAPWDVRRHFRRTTFVHVELPALTYSERERLWRVRLGDDGPDEATVRAVASTFRLTGGQIRDAAVMARTIARWRANGTTGSSAASGSAPAPDATRFSGGSPAEGGSAIQAHDLYTACRAQSSGRLGTLAHKINTTYRWNDIVLPPDQLGQLREVCVQVRHRQTVLEQWGFDRHLAMGKGVNVLFAGQSGTGKTMAAEIIAADLGLELYKVDLSTLVSKYIGETEKNLDRIFTAAREANAILFFDEADAIFGKRSEVKDAHDRYANIEVGYLLQKMEEYDGVVILATNLRKNLDDAFVRRLHVAIDFPFPEDADRQRIWRKVFPPDAPLAADLDVPFLARQFKLAGGNVRNIALLAAYLAAEEGNVIAMTHVVRAVKREYQKLGKLVTEREFGAYLGAARG